MQKGSKILLTKMLRNVKLYGLEGVKSGGKLLLISTLFLVRGNPKWRLGGGDTCSDYQYWKRSLPRETFLEPVRKKSLKPTQFADIRVK